MSGDPNPGRVLVKESSILSELHIKNASISVQRLLGRVIVDSGWARDPETGLSGKSFSQAVADHFDLNRHIRLDSRHGEGPVLCRGIVLPVSQLGLVARAQVTDGRVGVLLSNQGLAEDTSFATQVTIARVATLSYHLGVQITSIEFPVGSREETSQRTRIIRDVFGDVPIFVESIGWSSSHPALVDEAVKQDIGIKLRTQNMVGKEEELVRAMKYAAQGSRKVILSGGHHHLTPMYDIPGIPDHLGYLTTLLAGVATYSSNGLGHETWLEKLVKGEVSSIDMDDKGIKVCVEGWTSNHFSVRAIEEARSEFLLSFNSCSVEQPVRELRDIIRDRTSSPYGSSHLQSRRVLGNRFW